MTTKDTKDVDFRLLYF